MTTPRYIKKGDKVCILSTARKVSPDDLAASIQVFEQWGLRVELGSTIGPVDNQYAGPDGLRIQDFQEALDNPEIKAIFFARGGYGSVRVLDTIRWDQFIIRPKWLIGFSDATVFHSHVHAKFAIATIHGVMPSLFRFDEVGLAAQQTLKDALFGEVLQYQHKHHSALLRIGNGAGQVIGGNISILYSMLGSESDLNTDGKILFIEDLDEYLYHVDRMMISLKRAGKLECLQGLVVGGLTDMNDNDIPFGKTAEQIVMEHVSGYPYPVCFDFPAGHLRDNRALRLGTHADLSVSSSEAILKFR